MARGGVRPNAGRKAGKLSKAKQAILDRAKEAAAVGETPLEYMLRVMRTSNDDKRRDAMAQAAAPYVHNRLAAVEHSGNEDKPVKTELAIVWGA